MQVLYLLAALGILAAIMGVFALALLGPARFGAWYRRRREAHYAASPDPLVQRQDD